MKKVLPCLWGLFFCFLACSPIPYNSIYGYEIEYQSIGRSSSEYIGIKEGLVRYAQKENDTLTHILNKRDYKALYHLLNKVNLDSLGELTVSSKKHQFDGALLTTLMIKDTQLITHKSPAFDHDNPPGEIKDLIAYLRKIGKQ